MILLGLAALSLVPAAAEAAPAAPSQLRGTALTDDRIRLRWQDNSCDETAFILQIEVDEEWRNVPFALDAETSSVILSGLEPATDYRLRVTAANGDGISLPSEPVDVRTFHPGPKCEVTSTRLCLMDGRYAVSATFEAAHFTGAQFAARAVPEGSRTGSFWFFDANNLEISVEMTDGSAVNGHVWITAGGLSNLEYRIQVIDTFTSETRTFINPTDSLCGIDDRKAFLRPLSSEVPAAKNKPSLATWPVIEADSFRPAWKPVKATCGLQNEAQLQLLGGRFGVSLDWRGDDGVIRTAMPRKDSANSGFFVVAEPDLADWAIKILDGRFFNQHFWLFWTPLSGREAWLRVTDSATGQERRFYSARGTACGRAETSAFPAAPN